MNSVALILLVSMAAAASGQAPGGILYASDDVRVNGKLVIGEVAIVAGDKVQTGRAAAELRLEGTLITLHAHSSLTLGPTVEFGCGAADLFTFGARTVRVSSAVITPTSSDALKLQVVQAGGTLTIMAVLGEATVNTSGQTLPLTAGRFVSLAGDKSCPALRQTQAGPPAPAISTHRKLVGILAGAGGGGAVAAILLARRRPASPSRP